MIKDNIDLQDYPALNHQNTEGIIKIVLVDAKTKEPIKMKDAPKDSPYLKDKETEIPYEEVEVRLKEIARFETIISRIKRKAKEEGRSVRKIINNEEIYRKVNNILYTLVRLNERGGYYQIVMSTYLKIKELNKILEIMEDK